MGQYMEWALIRKAAVCIYEDNTQTQSLLWALARNVDSTYFVSCPGMETRALCVFLSWPLRILYHNETICMSVAHNTVHGLQQVCTFCGLMFGLVLTNLPPLYSLLQGSEGLWSAPKETLH